MRYPTASNTMQTNPYAAPGDVPKALHGPRNKLAHSHLKQLYFASILVPVGLTFAVGARSTTVLGLGSLVAMIAATVFFCAWWHRSWENLPARHRQGTSAGGAVAYLFVPVYGLVWQVTASRRMIRFLEEKLAKYPTRVLAPKSLAIWAPALSCVSAFFVGFVLLFGRYAPVLMPLSPFVLATPLVWYGLMTRVDLCVAEIELQRAAKKRRQREAEEVVTATDS